MKTQWASPAGLKRLLVNRYLIFLLTLVGSTEILSHYGGLPSLLPAWHMEIPLVLYFYWLANRLLRPNRLQPWLAASSIFISYHFFDFYHIQLGRLLRFTEVTELPELFQILSGSNQVLCGLLVVLPLLAILLSVNWRRISITCIGAIPLAALIASVVFLPDPFMAAFIATQKNRVFYSDTQSAGSNGRIATALYNEAKRRSSIEKTTNYQGGGVSLSKFSRVSQQVAKKQKKRNVHLVVLESFFDPSLLKNANFSKNPAHSDFTKLFSNKGSLSISPVFGGGTAQAEFEVLCGVPALRELSGIEFDVFTGAETLCLPNILKEGGYQTLATNAFLPDFFNSTNAYAGLGFSETYYPREYAPGLDSYFSTGDVTNEKYMFDGDLLRQNLEFVSQQIQTNKDQPIFNYVISMYGHLPHSINTDKRPQIITLQGDYHDDQLERAVNQYYYRSQAVAAYVKKLTKVDPDSLIILVSDHLPPLTYGPNTYRAMNYLNGVENDIYLNRIYFIENGKPTKFNTIHHYDLPQIILNYVTRGDYCKEEYCGFEEAQTEAGKMAYRDEYMTIMARAMF
jgi:phosphoglycerol transferase MdoB-like AlkP superfamily enzyme